MEKNGWRTLALILSLLIIFVAGLTTYVVQKINAEEKNMNICYYDICNEYADAFYENNVCYCYEQSLLGEMVIAKTEYMK